MCDMVGEDKYQRVQDGGKVVGMKSWRDYCPEGARSVRQLGEKLGASEKEICEFERVLSKFSWQQA